MICVEEKQHLSQAGWPHFWYLARKVRQKTSSVYCYTRVQRKRSQKPHCSGWNPTLFALAIIVSANKNFSAVLKSASRIPITWSWWNFQTPFFFSNITLMTVVHRWWTKPWWNGGLIIMYIQEENNSSQVMHFQMDQWTWDQDEIVLSFIALKASGSLLL